MKKPSWSYYAKHNKALSLYQLHLLASGHVRYLRISSRLQASIKNGSEDHIPDNEIIDNILSSYKEYGII